MGLDFLNDKSRLSHQTSRGTRGKVIYVMIKVCEWVVGYFCWPTFQMIVGSMLAACPFIVASHFSRAQNHPSLFLPKVPDFSGTPFGLVDTWWLIPRIVSG